MKTSASTLLALPLLLCIAASAAVRLPHLFSDHAVLQRSPRCAVWGQAAPGERVVAAVAGATATATADAGGEWRLFLDLSKATEGPHLLTVNDQTIRDVLIGDVWLCSGQSNMQFTMRTELGVDRQRGEAPRLKGRLRCFCTRLVAAATPQRDVPGTWFVLDSRNIDLFQAVSYYFGREIVERANVPVGLIQSSWGGTPVEAWMDQESLAAFPDEVALGAQRLQRFRDYPQMVEEYLPRRAAWEQRFGRQDPPHTPPPRDAAWRKTREGLHPGFGLVWFRRTVVFDQAEVSRPIRLHFSYQHAPFSVFVDGREIASHSVRDAVWNNPFIFDIPPNTLAPGPHVFMLRYHVSCQPVVELLATYRFGPHAFRLAEWETYRERDYGRPSGPAMAAYPKGPGTQVFDRNLFHHLYNGMIHPHTPAAIRGFIWYQGENDARRPQVYARVFPALVTGWRRKFRDEALPFHFCQLPAYTARVADVNATGWAPLRAAQDQALALPKVGRAVLIDTGEAQDIHPRDKRLAGLRLAALALDQDYGIPTPCLSPVATRARLQGNAVRVSFRHAPDGLVLRPIPAEYNWNSSSPREATRPMLRHSPQAQVEDVALQDADGTWHWADDASLDDDELVASAKAVPRPVAIRYCYVPFPIPTIFSTAGLPAAPFQLKVEGAPADARPMPANWDPDTLFQIPRATPATGLTFPFPVPANIRPVLLEGLPHRGRPTRFFAWVGLPPPGAPRPAGRRIPGVVLVHGGGGTAFLQWVEAWTRRGYAAIAMDTVGCLPVRRFEAQTSCRIPLEGGGPRKHDFAWDTAHPRDSWTAHAVAAVIRSHSHLRSLPEVDPDRIGITGISWGGYLTGIAAALDPRFAAAVPVYGCGFLSESDWTVKGAPEEWLARFDPARFLPFVKCPTLFVNRPDDQAYFWPQWVRSSLLPKHADRSCRPGLGHSHAAGVVQEAMAFFDACFQGAPPLPHFQSQSRADGVVTAVFQNAAEVRKAMLVWTGDDATVPCARRKWRQEPARFRDGVASAPIPVGAKACFLNVVDARGNIVSSPGYGWE